MRTAIVLLLLLASSACKKSTTETPEPPAPAPAPTEVTPTPGGDMKDAVSASNRFGLALYQRLRAEPGNLAYSPASLSIALAMTHAGARGETARQMRTTLAIGEDVDVDASWASVLSRWQAVTGVEIAVANRLFGDKQYTFDTSYLGLTGARYGAPLEAVDFAGAPEAQRKRINAWVEDKTKKRIRELVPPLGVTSDTRMALVNAMYFKAKWLTPFNEAMTSDGPFAAPGGSVQVPMMVQTEHMQYGEVGGVQLAQRSYEEGGFGALFVLPETGTDLADLEAKLDADLLETWTSALYGTKVAMTLPRFKIDPASSFELKTQLVAMGMRLPFEPIADFTGITNPPNPDDRLYIEKVFHKAFVAMDEAGTEAAAATAVMMARAGGPPPAEPKKFVADRPFLFFVRDLETGLVMFAGRVLNPAG